MKIINYNYGYSNTFSCSIHGTIEMTQAEYKEVKDFLTTNKLQDWLLSVRDSLSTYFYKDILEEDLNRKIIIKNGFLLNVRVTATDYIVRRFKPEGAQYKRANYQLRIIC